MRRAFDVAACMDDSGIDPITGEAVHADRHLRDRKLQRALLPFFKPENDFAVRKALLKAGRGDRIGSGCDALIPAQPPMAAMRARMERANRELTEGRYVHQVDGDGSRPPDRGRSGPEGGRASAGYRPGRAGARRRKK